MTQNIHFSYREKAMSDPLNERFLDITGPCVLRGFRLALGSANFKISLVRDIYISSVAVVPNGARVEETADLADIITISPNTDPTQTRVDTIYVSYVYGTENAVATYLVVAGTPGSSVPGVNPDPANNTALGYITVPAASAAPVAGNLSSVGYGFSQLKVAGPASFAEEVTFKKTVTLSQPLTLPDGSQIGAPASPGTTQEKSRVDRFDNPVVAAPGQTAFPLPSGKSYVTGTNSLFVFVDNIAQSPSAFTETDSQTFTFKTAMSGGEKVWAYWFQGFTMVDVGALSNDDRYYTKDQITAQRDRYFQDTFNGTSGRTLTHNLGNTNYVVVGVVPTSNASDVGYISVVKDANTITVYNTGTYRGTFDLTYNART